MTNLICKNLTIKIGDKTICQNLNLNIKAGEFWAILGSNGSGKTTLLHTLAGLRKPNSGQIVLNNKNLNKLSRTSIARKLAILLQTNYANFPATLLDTALTGRYPHLKRWSLETEQDLTIAKEALSAMDLEELIDRDVNTLSGGELQRLRLATLLTQTPEFFLLDEPLTNLDPKHQTRVLEHFTKQAWQNQKAVIMVGHEIHLLQNIPTKLILLMENGEVLIGESSELLKEPLLIKRLYSM